MREMFWSITARVFAGIPSNSAPSKTPSQHPQTHQASKLPACVFSSESADAAKADPKRLRSRQLLVNQPSNLAVLIDQHIDLAEVVMRHSKREPTKLVQPVKKPIEQRPVRHNLVQVGRQHSLEMGKYYECVRDMMG